MNNNISAGFGMSFIDENGDLNRIRSMSAPEDFIREARRNEDKADKYEKMANKRKEKLGKDDEQAEELRWAARMARDEATGDREMAKILRENQEREQEYERDEI